MSIWDTMARHHGVASLADFRAAGVPDSTVRQWEHDNTLMRLHHGVYAASGSPNTFHRACWGALKAAPGSAISHRAGSWLWDLYEDVPPVEIVVMRGRTPALRGVIVHQTRDPFAIHTRSGLLVTSPLRAVLDLGAVANVGAVYHAVDKGRVMGLFSIAALEWQLADLARQGRRGSGALRKVLDEWALGDSRPDGLLEPRFARLRARYGLPQPVFQYPVGDFRIDFAYPDLMIAIEVDGYEKRATPAAQTNDYERQNALVGLGWEVLRFTWSDVVRRPAYVARQIADAIGRARDGISA